MGLIAFLIGNKMGRYIAGALLVLAMVGLVLLSVRRGGENAAKLARQLETLQAIRERIKVDETVRSMPVADRRDALRSWVRQAR
jgi:hypothetical protein